MELNIKSRFNIGDEVVVTRTNETGYVRKCRVTVEIRSTSTAYFVDFDNYGGWVAELDLKGVKPASKFKLGDAVAWDDQHGVVTEVFDDNIVAVEVTTDSVHRYLFYESELSPYTPTSPHYFQD